MANQIYEYKILKANQAWTQSEYDENNHAWMQQEVNKFAAHGWIVHSTAASADDTNMSTIFVTMMREVNDD